jgi:hypothetical protein
MNQHIKEAKEANPFWPLIGLKDENVDWEKYL